MVLDLKIAIIGIVGLPASYGGFETLVENLVMDASLDATVYCSGPHYKSKPSKFKSSRLVYLPISANGPMSVLYDIWALLHAIANGHRQLLILGISGAVILPVIKFFSPSIHIVTNIDGIEWRRDKWGKFAKWFLQISEALAVKNSSVIIADNKAIADYVRTFYSKDCETIAYGGDHAVVEFVAEKIECNLTSINDFAFSVCRIEPENNVQLILESFAFTKKPLVFVGNWQSSLFGRELFRKYSGVPNMRLLNPIYDLKTLAVYRMNCFAYIHGHSAGGTNPSLVEMMHFNKPIIAFDCIYNRATMDNHGSFFSTYEELNEIINADGPLPGGAELVQIARRRYTWDFVRKMYLDLFDH